MVPCNATAPPPTTTTLSATEFSALPACLWIYVKLPFANIHFQVHSLMNCSGCTYCSSLYLVQYMISYCYLSSNSTMCVCVQVPLPVSLYSTCSKRSLFTFSHVYNKLIPSDLNGISKRADQTLIQISSSHAAPFRPHHVIIWFISQTPPITMKDTSHMVFHHTRHCCPLVIIIIRNNQLHTLNTNDHVSTNQIYLLEHLHTEHQSQGCIFKYDYQSACI